MTKTVVGLYDQPLDAEEAVQDLINIGFDAQEISLISNDSQGEQARRLGIKSASAEDAVGADEEQENVEARDASIGAAVGGIGGLLVGLGLFMIPGIGPVLGAGPIITALGGAGVGAVTGGMVGALAGSGVSRQDAEIFTEGLRRGGTLLLVATNDDAADKAAQVMNRHQPADLEERSKEWGKLGWQGFNENKEQYAFDTRRESFHKREGRSELDYGLGARSYLSGQSISDYDRSSTNMGRYVEPHPAKDWKMYESRFRDHFKTHYEQSGKRWDDYSDAYHFGYNMGQETPYTNEPWNVVAPYLQENWEGRYIGRSWADFVDAVRDGWEVGHVPH